MSTTIVETPLVQDVTRPVETYYEPTRMGTIETRYGDRRVVVVSTDQNPLKGILWGFVGFKLAGVTLIGAAVTVGTAIAAPLITPIPAIFFGIGTYKLAKMTGTCVDNAMYHLGSTEKIVVIRG